MCTKLPLLCPVQPGSRHRPKELVLDQCLASWSVLYRPESILAATTAFLTSNGLFAASKSGCGDDSDMYLQLKYLSEGSRVAWKLYLFSQKSITLDLVSFFQDSFDGGVCRMRSGSGKQYSWQMERRAVNQDFPGYCCSKVKLRAISSVTHY